MIKRSTLIASALLCTTAILGLAAPGCGSDSDSGGGGATDAGTGSYTSRKPNARPTAKATGSTVWFAINALKLGLTTKDGKSDPAAWKDYGYDLDSRNTTADDSKTSANSCKRKSGSSTKMLMDGNNGIDNNFGQHVMSVIKSLKSDAEDSVTAAVKDGSFTLLMKIDNFTTGDNDKAPGFVYVANDFKDKASAPTFAEGETGWKIVDGSLVDGKTIANPKLQFPDAYIAGGYWVSGDFGKGTIELAISLSGADIKLPIDSGIISMKVDGTDGTIGGAMNTDKLKEALTPVAKKFGICPGNATYDQVVDTLTQSADLVSLAPNLQDTTKECNAISIALGFTAKKIGDHSAAPIKVSSTDPGKDDCAGDDAGVGDAATGG